MLLTRCAIAAHYLTCVQDLLASENSIDSVDGIFANQLCLQRIKLGTNRLAALPPLPWMPHLRTLDLSDNPLAALPPFTMQPALTSLSLAFCALDRCSIAAAVAPLGHLANLQAHDNAADAEAEADSQPASLAEMPAVPWLRELDHTEMAPRQAVSAAVQALVGAPHLLSEWRRGILSWPCTSAPVTDRMLDRMLEQGGEAAVRGVPHAALCGIFGLFRGLRGPERASARPSPQRAPPAARTRAATPDRQQCAAPHAAAELHMKLKEQRALLAARTAGCSQLHRALSGAAPADPSLCVKQLSSALHQAQAAAATAALTLSQWQPRPRQPHVQVNRAWQARWAADRAAAAARIQHAWRARRARSSLLTQRRSAAAARIQAWCRGRTVRASGVLAALRRERDAARARAALTVQAAWRGHRVRRRLRNARLAARLHGDGLPRAQAAVGVATGESAPSSGCGSEDLALPELGADLLRELDMLGGGDGGGSAIVSDADWASLGAVRLEGHPPSHGSGDKDLGLLTAAGTSGGSVALPCLRPQAPPSAAAPPPCSAGSGPCSSRAAGAPAGREPLQVLLGPDSALLRRYEEHRRRQVAPVHAHDAHAPPAHASSAHAALLPAAQPPPRGCAGSAQPCMPHVHTAALAAMRLRHGSTLPPQHPSAAESPAERAEARRSASESRSEGRSSGSAPEPQSAHDCSAEAASAPQPQPPGRHQAKVQALMAEWGFHDPATAEAFLLSQRHMLQARTSRARRARLADPTARLQVRLTNSISQHWPPSLCQCMTPDPAFCEHPVGVHPLPAVCRITQQGYVHRRWGGSFWLVYHRCMCCMRCGSASQSPDRAMQKMKQQMAHTQHASAVEYQQKGVPTRAFSSASPVPFHSPLSAAALPRIGGTTARQDRQSSSPEPGHSLPVAEGATRTGRLLQRSLGDSVATGGAALPPAQRPVSDAVGTRTGQFRPGPSFLNKGEGGLRVPEQLMQAWTGSQARWDA